MHEEGSKFCEGLLAATADADEHSIASRLAEDPCDSENVLKRVIKKDEVQLIIGGDDVVFLFFLQSFDDDSAFVGDVLVVDICSFEFE